MPGGALDVVVAVRLHQGRGGVDEGFHILDLIDGKPGSVALAEQRLTHVDEPETGDHALVEQGLADRSLSALTYP